jgi:hypothetical protein
MILHQFPPFAASLKVPILWEQLIKNNFHDLILHIDKEYLSDISKMNFKYNVTILPIKPNLP